MDKEKLYIMEYYLPLTKKKNLLFLTTQMNLEGIMLSEIRQKYYTVWLICGILKQNRASNS